MAASIIAAFVAGFGLAYVIGDRQRIQLQAYSDSVAAVAAARLADALAEDARLRDSAAVLRAPRRSLKVVADSFRAEADSSASKLPLDTTARDSTTRLLGIASNLRLSNDSLRRALTLAEGEVLIQTKRADQLLVKLREQTDEVARLNQRIHALMPRPRMPTWLRTASRVVVLSATFYAGMQFERQAND